MLCILSHPQKLGPKKKVDLEKKKKKQGLSLSPSPLQLSKIFRVVQTPRSFTETSNEFLHTEAPAPQPRSSSVPEVSEHRYTEGRGQGMGFRTLSPTTERGRGKREGLEVEGMVRKFLQELP